MAKDTKERIMGAAVDLFNERGYAQVSLRDIAKAADIAIGGLTYHFARKEDLIACILSDLHADFSTGLGADLSCEETLETMADLFVSAERNQERYPFYFRNIDSIVESSPELGKENAEFAATLTKAYAQAFARLAEAGWISGFDANKCCRTAASFVALHGSWSTIVSPVRSGATEPFPIATALATLLFGLLAVEHREFFIRICADRGIGL
jgi:AcrR family transcriptional regulator